LLARRVHNVTSKYHLLAWLCVLAGGCQTVPAPSADTALPPVRFLLTFDDGPSADPDNNTTLRILAHLDSNRVQPGAKALFFVQTRNADGGGTELGRELLRVKHRQGHALGLHSGTERGHVRHTLMSTDELVLGLRQGTDDLRAIAGDQALLVRPPYWGHNNQTVGLYAAHGYRMLLTDVNSRDGTMFHNIFGMQNRIHKSLQRTRQAIERGELPVHNGVIPLVVTFHDLNLITSHSVSYYMRMLTEQAAAAGLRVADKPFYDSRAEILEVASLRAETPETLARKTNRLKPGSPAPASTTTAALVPTTALD
jgi:peptidoglycan/xylan/chitin deacetylase (PgdA/CDA1 family)